MTNLSSHIVKPDLTTIGSHQLEDLTTSSLYSILGEYGVVLFRGGMRSPEEFSKFVSSHSSRISLDPARNIVADAAQLVDAGVDAVGLHCENGNSPFWPDITWFYCAEAPRKGSQTTICDGEEVLVRLSDRCRLFFEENDIRYRRNVPGLKWRRLVCHYTPELDDPALVVIDNLLDLVADDSGTTISYNPKTDEIEYSLTVSAIQRSSFSDRDAFANSILGPSFNYEKPLIDTVLGAPIPNMFLSEIQTVTAQVTRPVGWQDHDMVMIDNRRVMHGREAICDTRRRIYNALSYMKGSAND